MSNTEICSTINTLVDILVVSKDTNAISKGTEEAVNSKLKEFVNALSVN